MGYGILQNGCSARPQLGRFISRDPIGYESGMNLYEYVASNPERYTDPRGLACCDYCTAADTKYFLIV